MKNLKGDYDIKINNNIKPNRTEFKFPPYSHTLGDKYNGRHVYDCRIMDYRTGTQDRVRVWASNFGEVKWCMMGYLKISLTLIDTTKRTTKHLVMPNDIGEKNFVCIVIKDE